MATEKRLIWGDIAESQLKKLADHYHGSFSGDAFERAMQLIAELPSVDAVEVVHGEWFSLTDCSNAGVYCSVCHKKVWKEDYAWCNKKNRLRSNYCPNCGAKMGGGGNV